MPDDLDLALAECRRAETARHEISDACARVIAALYHNGQATIGCSFATTGAIEDPAAVWQDLFDSPRGYYLSMGSDRIVADMLGTYLVRAGRRGPVPGWDRLWLRPQDAAHGAGGGR